jgi:hypothetical protein
MEKDPILGEIIDPIIILVQGVDKMIGSKVTGLEIETEEIKIEMITEAIEIQEIEILVDGGETYSVLIN